MESPCKQCEQRSPECHGKCDPYLNWAAWKRKESIQTNKAKAALDKMYDYGGKWRRCVYIGRTKR